MDFRASHFMAFFVMFEFGRITVTAFLTNVYNPNLTDYDATQFRKFCKGPFVSSCQRCGIPVYPGGEAKVAGQCISAIVRDKNMTSEKRAIDGTFSFQSSVTPLDPWMQYDGFEIRLLQFIAEAQGFYIVLHDWDDWQEKALKSSLMANTNTDDPDLAKHGILALVSDGVFDIAIGSFTAVLPSNAGMPVKYTDGFLSMSVVLVQRLPPSSKEVQSIPFPPLVILAALLILAVYAILWTLAQKVFLDRHTQNGTSGLGGMFMTRRTRLLFWIKEIGTSFLDVLSTVFNQDLHKANRGTNIGPAGFAVLGTWWLYVVLFIGIYTANMTTKMSVTYGDTTPVTGLDSLAFRPDIVPIVKRDSVLSNWLEDRKHEPMYAEIWSKLQANPTLFSDLSQGDTFKLIRDGSAGERVLITSVKASFVYGKDILCESHIQPINYRFWKAFPIAPKNTHLRRKLTQGISRSMVSAVLSKLTRDFAIDNPPSCQAKPVDFGLANLSITNLDMTFTYLGYAFLICFIVAMVETAGSCLSIRKTYDLRVRVVADGTVD